MSVNSEYKHAKTLHIPMDIWEPIKAIVEAEGRNSTAVIFDLLRQALREKMREIELMKNLED